MLVINTEDYEDYKYLNKVLKSKISLKGYISTPKIKKKKNKVVKYATWFLHQDDKRKREKGGELDFKRWWWRRICWGTGLEASVSSSLSLLDSSYSLIALFTSQRQPYHRDTCDINPLTPSAWLSCSPNSFYLKLRILLLQLLLSHLQILVRSL